MARSILGCHSVSIGPHSPVPSSARKSTWLYVFQPRAPQRRGASLPAKQGLREKDWLFLPQQRLLRPLRNRCRIDAITLPYSQDVNRAERDESSRNLSHPEQRQGHCKSRLEGGREERGSASRQKSRSKRGQCHRFEPNTRESARPQRVRKSRWRSPVRSPARPAQPGLCLLPGDLLARQSRAARALSSSSGRSIDRQLSRGRRR